MKKTLLFLTILIAFNCCKKDDETETPPLTDYPVVWEFNRIEDNSNTTTRLFIQGGEITNDSVLSASTTAQELSNSIFPQRADWVYQNITLNDASDAEILLSVNQSAEQDDYNPVAYTVAETNYVFTTANNVRVESTVNENNNELTIPYYSYYKVSSQFPPTLDGHVPLSFTNFFVDTTNFVQGDTMATILYDVIYKLTD